MTRPPFYLTRQAARDLRDIHTRSVASWGEERADVYLATIYAVFAKIAAAPDLGRLRAHRCAPFLMDPAGPLGGAPYVDAEPLAPPREAG